MKRTLCLVALAGAVACSSKARSYPAGSTATPPAPATEETAVIQPSELSPDQVRLVQRALVDRGFAVDPGGTFDDRTQTALMDFQRARGLPATGNLNQPTIDALGIDPRDVMPAR
jgi:peptidoglycan hydrolase-like protein with peptidoglycan-binding domain